MTEDRTEDYTEDYTVLAVCTGNICRSPAMERLLAQELADVEGLRVHSAGTYAHDGEDMQPPMRRRLEDHGAETGGFTARQVTAAMIEESDLILTATREHVDDVVAEVPDARARTFTVREIGRLLAHQQGALKQRLRESPAEADTLRDRLAAVVDVLDQARRQDGPPGPDDDVVDPYMLPRAVYEESFRQINEPIQALTSVIRR
ncbi:arsenate reductase/protein-tyrosine-phosphatase family protein [Nesterenkonia suensis]